MVTLSRTFKPYVLFQWQLESTNSCFWLVKIVLRKFDTSWKKETKMIKTDTFNDEKQNKNAKKVYENIK